MATHDYVLDNATGANFRSDLNNALAAIVSNNSSSSEPSTKYAYQWWADTTTGILKIRNSANDGWVELFKLDGTITLADGSNSAPSLAFSDDSNTGIFSSAADTLDITCGGTTRGSFSSSGLTVTGGINGTGGNIVLGDSGSSSDDRLQFGASQDLNLFHDGTDSHIRNNEGKLIITNDDSGGDDLHLRGKVSEESIICRRDGAVELYFDNAKKAETVTGGFTVTGTCTATAFAGDGSALTGVGGTTINNNGDNRVITGDASANTLNAKSNVVIDSSSRLILGTAGASREVGDVTSQMQVEGIGFASSSLSLISNAGASAGNTPHLTLGKSRGSSAGSNTIVADDDALGQIQFAGADGTDCNSVAASIIGRVDGTPGSNDMPGRLVFSTAADGAATPTERMKIDSTGDVTISDGDLVIGTDGHGIDFSVTADGSGSSQAEILDDYEEGSWTPGSVTGTVAVASNGEYVKIGRFVQITVLLYNWSDTSSSSSVLITGIPFSANSGGQYVGQVWLRRTTTGNKNYQCTIGNSAVDKVDIVHDSNGSDMGGNLQHSDFAHSTPYTNITIQYQSF